VKSEILVSLFTLSIVMKTDAYCFYPFM